MKKLKLLFSVLGLMAINLQLFATQVTTQESLSAENKTYYDMNLIQEAEAELVHDQFAQKKPIPKNGGKKIEFRKYASLNKALTPLTEGVTPAGNNLKVTTIEAEVSQYGDFIEMSDVLDLTAIDNNILEASKLLGSQAGRTLDTVTREVLQSGTNVSYASKWNGSTEIEVTSRKELDNTSILKVDTVKRMVTKLKKVNAKKINGDYVAIIHPDVSYDLMSDPEWIDSHKYATPENLYNGEIGKIGGCRFVETTEAKVYAPAPIGGLSRLTVKTAISSSSNSVVVNEEIESVASCEIPCYINGVENKITAITKGTNQSTLTVETAITSLAADTIVCGKGGTKDGLAVFGTLFLAANAYGVTEIEGGGLRTIIKQMGSAGTSDPLDQRATVGWKGMKTAEILIGDYIIRCESVSPKYSETETAN